MEPKSSAGVIMWHSEKMEQNCDHHHHRWHVKTLLQLRVWKGRGSTASWETVNLIRTCWGITHVGGWLPVYGFDKEKQDWCRNRLSDSHTRKHLERLRLDGKTRLYYAIAQTWRASFVERMKKCQAAEESVRLSAHKKSCKYSIPFQDFEWKREDGYKKSEKFHWQMIGLTRVAFIGWKVSLSLSECSRRISREDKNVDRCKNYKC